jgi:hypothetical protein
LASWKEQSSVQAETLRNPEALRRTIKRLVKDPRPGVSDALAEAHFRLAVHPSTERSAALAALFQAVRLDSTNPKFAYHLARWFFVHGELARAAEWLKRAARLSPTSHRIVAHIALLQRELNEHHKNDSRYDADALRTRSERLASAILDGKDAFPDRDLDLEPKLGLAAIEADARKQQAASGGAPAVDPRCARPPGQRAAPATASASPENRPARILNAGTCRWSGVVDIEAEWLLAGAATGRTRDRLLPLLEKIAEHAPRRLGGSAGFAVFAIQWLIAGYAVESIQRLGRALLEQREDPAIQLLQHVIDAFEAPPSQVAGQLAELVRSGQMPSLLAAAIHQRRLLWQPTTFGAIAAFQRARALVAEPQVGDRDPGGASRDQGPATTNLLKELNAAVQSFFPSPTPPIPDRPVEARPEQRLDLAGATDRLSRLNAIASELRAAGAAAFEFLKDNLEPRSKITGDAAQLALAQADHDVYEHLQSSLEAAVAAGLLALETLTARMACQAEGPPPGGSPAGLDPGLAPFFSQRDACKDIYNDITARGAFQKVLKRVARNLERPTAPAERSKAGPSPALSEILLRIKRASHEQVLDAVRATEAEPGGHAREDISPAWDPSSTREGGAAPLEAELHQADEIDKRIAVEWEQLKQLLAQHQASALDASDPTLQRITDFVSWFENECQAALGRVARMREHSEVHDPARLSALEDRLREIVSRPGGFRRTLKKLPIPRPAHEATASGTPDHETAPPAASALPAAIEQVLGCISTRFERLDASLEPYGASLRTEAPLRALRQWVRGRHAELLYRLGEVAAARRRWASLIYLDPVSPAPRKNLAVLDTLHGDTARSLAAWQAYAESLYLFPLSSGDPRQMADQRVELHAAFAEAHVPQCLMRAPKNNETQEEAEDRRWSLRQTITNERAFATFVTHKRLELLTRKFKARSPSILLGVARDATDKHRNHAAERLVKFAKDACSDLGPRLSEPTANMLLVAIEQARQHASVAKQRLVEHDPFFEQDHKDYVDWLRAILGLKMALLIELHRDNGWVNALRSAAFLHGLVLLDEIPLDLDKQLTLNIAKKAGTDQALRTDLSAMAFNQIVSYLRDADAAVASTLHQRLMETWQDHPALAQFGQWLDYPDGMTGVERLPDNERGDGVTDHDDTSPERVLRRLRERLPRSVVVRLRLTLVLVSREAYDEALALVRSATQDALTAELRKHAEELQQQVQVRARARHHQGRIEKLLQQTPPRSEAEAKALSEKLGGVLVEVEQDIASNQGAPSSSVFQDLATQIRTLIQQADSAKAQLAAQAILSRLVEDYKGIMATQPKSIDDFRQLQSKLTTLLATVEQAQRDPACAPASEQLQQLMDSAQENLSQVETQLLLSSLFEDYKRLIATQPQSIDDFRRLQSGLTTLLAAVKQAQHEPVRAPAPPQPLPQSSRPRHPERFESRLVSEQLQRLADNIHDNLGQIEIQVRCHPYQQRLDELLKKGPESETEAEALSQQFGQLLREIKADISKHQAAPSNSMLEKLATQIRNLIQQADSVKAQLVTQAILNRLFEDYKNLMATQPESIDDLRRLQSGLTTLLAAVKQAQHDPARAPASEQLQRLTDNVHENLGQIEIQVRCRPYQERLDELLKHGPESAAEAEVLSQQLGRLLREIEADISKHRKAPWSSMLQKLAPQIRSLIQQAETARVQLAASAVLSPLFKEYEDLMSMRPSSSDDLYHLRSGLTALLERLGEAQRNPACAPASAQAVRLGSHIIDNLNQIDRLQARMR